MHPFYKHQQRIYPKHEEHNKEEDIYYLAQPKGWEEEEGGTSHEVQNLKNKESESKRWQGR